MAGNKLPPLFPTEGRSGVISIEEVREMRVPVVWQCVDSTGHPVQYRGEAYIGETKFTQKLIPKEVMSLKDKLEEMDAANPAGAPHSFSPFVQMSHLRKVLTLAIQWKNNHDAQVERARVLLERVDLPLPRVRAYQTLVRLEQENATLREKASQPPGDMKND